MSVDLSQFDAVVSRQEEGIDVDILGMDNKTSIGLTIRVAGPDSQRALLAQEVQSDELIERGDTKPPKAAERRRRGIRYLAMITINWSPAVKLGGEELEYSQENAEKVYERFAFIRDQVDTAAGSRLRFMNG